MGGSRDHDGSARAIGLDRWRIVFDQRIEDLDLRGRQHLHIAAGAGDVGLDVDILIGLQGLQQHIARGTDRTGHLDRALGRKHHQGTCGIGIAAQAAGRDIDGITAAAVGARQGQAIALGDEGTAAALVGQCQAGHLGAQVLRSGTDPRGRPQHHGRVAHDQVVGAGRTGAVVEVAAQAVDDGAGGGLQQSAAIGLQAADGQVASGKQIGRAEPAGAHRQQGLAVTLRQIARRADFDEAIARNPGLKQRIAAQGMHLDQALGIAQRRALHHILAGLDGQGPAIEGHGPGNQGVALTALCQQVDRSGTGAEHAQAALRRRQDTQARIRGAHLHEAGAHLGKLLDVQLPRARELGEDHRTTAGVGGLDLVDIQEAQVRAGGGAHGQRIGHQGLTLYAVAQTGNGIALEHQALGRVKRDVLGRLQTRLDAVLQGDVVDRIERDGARHLEEEVRAGRHVGHHDGAAVDRQVVPEQRRTESGMGADTHLTSTADRVAAFHMTDDDATEAIDQGHEVARRQVQALWVRIRRIADLIAQTQAGRAQGQLAAGAADRLAAAQEVDLVGFDDDIATDAADRVDRQRAVEDDALGPQDGEVAALNVDALGKTHGARSAQSHIALQDHLALKGHVVGQVEDTRADLDTGHAQAFKRILRMQGLSRLGKANAAHEGHIARRLDRQAVGARLAVPVDDVPGLTAQNHVARTVGAGHSGHMTGQDQRIVERERVGDRDQRILVPVRGKARSLDAQIAADRDRLVELDLPAHHRVVDRDIVLEHDL